MSDATIESLVPSSAASHDQDALHAEAVRNLIDGTRPSDHWLIRASDWCSPILVKEVRQALKSRQFNWTLVLLMIFIAIWTAFAIVSMLPGIYYFPAGGTLLSGYFFLLLIPTILVVPNSAYRSMASELEQGTFDVLTITPLSPLKIVLGKLTVAMVQSLIFFSALAPCMALSYLLRGLPIIGIAIVLGWTAILSLLASSIGILLATGNRNKAFGTFLSIVMIIICFAASFVLYLIYYGNVSSFASPQYESIFVSLAGAILVLGYTGVCLLAASASIGVAGENYSTRIRWCVLIISWLWVAIILAANLMLNQQRGTRSFDDEIVMGLGIVLAIHWGVFGMFFIAERGVTSPRAQRRLPVTLLGRTFLSWLNPGSGTGYLFSLASYAGCMGGLCFGLVTRWGGDSQLFDACVYCLILAAYLVIYLGLTRLVLVVLDFFPKLIGSRMLMAPCFGVLFLLIGVVTPLLLSGFLNGTGAPAYEWYTIMNPFWSMLEYNRFPQVSSQVLLIVVGSIVFSLNFATLGRDVTMVRVEAPPRVLEETKVSEDVMPDSPFE